MDVVFERCAGIDVHKRTVVACRLTRDVEGQPLAQTQTFGTTTGELLRLSDWLVEGGCSHVGLESTGEYWKPIYNLLEGTLTVWLLNAQHIKAVPGRKTDVKDAQWIAELLRHGLVRPSFIPPPPQRELRDLTRSRTPFVRERAPLVNRVQQVLESTNLKLASVVSDVMGVSSRAILAALLAGEADPFVLAGLAQGQLRKKRPQLEQALQGRLRPHQSFVLTELLAQIDSLEETIARFDAQIRDACAARDDAAQVVALLDTIPGIAEGTAQLLVAEIGTDRSRFPSAAALAAWAGLAPGNNESAGRGLPAQWPHPQGQRLAPHGPCPGSPGRRAHEAYRAGGALPAYCRTAGSQESCDRLGSHPARDRLSRHLASRGLPRIGGGLSPADRARSTRPAARPAVEPAGLRRRPAFPRYQRCAAC